MKRFSSAALFLIAFQSGGLFQKVGDLPEVSVEPYSIFTLLTVLALLVLNMSVGFLAGTEWTK